MKPSVTCIFVLLSCLALCWPATALVINVPADQPTIQAGINTAVAGDTVLVADGTYYENIDFLGKAITVTSVNGPASTTIDGGAAGNVVTFQNLEGNDSVIERFTITNGERGIYCLGADEDNLTSPTIRDNVITANHSTETGGGIYSYYSGAVIRQNTITGNTATHGGGILCRYCFLDIEQNEITGNSATEGAGGGLSHTYCDGDILRNTITGNDASTFGGGMYVNRSFTTGHGPLVSGNEVRGNTSYWHGGGCYVNIATNAEFYGNIFADNEAGDQGGAIFSTSNQPWFLTGNQITGNSANEGGGLYAEEGSITVTNNLVAYNTAQWKGGGIRLAGCPCTMRNNTIVHNQALDAHGGGIYAFNTVFEMTNCILYFNTAQFGISKEIWGGGSCTISYCDVEGGQASIEPDAAWGPGNIDADPLLVDGPYAPACLSYVAAGQAVNSPCRDAGAAYSSAVEYETHYGTVKMNQVSTRTDQLADTWLMDLGWHYEGWPANSVGAWMSGNPPSGTLPFSVQFTAGLINRYLAQSRRMTLKIDVTLANGSYYSNWRGGYTNLDRGVTFTRTWSQYFPALGTLVGTNQFDLTAVDVTPAPFNQPPYPPSGDTATGSCTVTGVSP